jgi:hypothetical protein
MYRECQELLQMFGLPYIMAPVEVRVFLSVDDNVAGAELSGAVL